MFRALFFTTLFVTLMVNIIFLFATKDKPPDPELAASTSTILNSVIGGGSLQVGTGSSSSRSFDKSEFYQSEFPSPPSSSLVSSPSPSPSASSTIYYQGARRLFLRSNDLYDYSGAAGAAAAVDAAESQVASTSDTDNNQSSQSRVSSSAAERLQSDDKQRSTAAVLVARLSHNSQQRAASHVARAFAFADKNKAAASGNNDHADADSDQDDDKDKKQANNNNNNKPKSERAPEKGFRIDNEAAAAAAATKRESNRVKEVVDEEEGTGGERSKQRPNGPLRKHIIIAQSSSSSSPPPPNDDVTIRRYIENNKSSSSSSSSPASTSDSDDDDENELSPPNGIASADEAKHQRGEGGGQIRTPAASRKINNNNNNNNSTVAATTTTTAGLNIRVKSSKSHVVIWVDNLIIYESGNAGAAGSWEDYKSDGSGGTVHLYQRRHVRSSARRRRRGNANFSVASPSADETSERRQSASDSSSSSSSSTRILAANMTPQEHGSKSTLAMTTTTRTKVAVNDDDDHDHDDHADDDQRRRQTEAARGIHVLVLNQYDGRVMARRIFDTYTPQQDDELALFLRQIQDGRLLIMAVQDEGSFKMARSSQARKLIKQLGSAHIMELAWRDMWAFATVKALNSAATTAAAATAVATSRRRVGALAEALSKSARATDWGAPVELELSFELADASKQEVCAFASDSPDARERRREFCARIEGYGRVCDCEFPSSLEFASRPIRNTQLWDVPILVLASNRPYYLYRMLRSLLAADGVDPTLVTVFIDGFYDEPKWLCKLLNVRYFQHAPRGTRSARISHHYKTSLSVTFERLFPLAKLAILFEEDLDVARDALIYFNHTRALLERDKSLYCVSAWNDQGYEHSVGSASQLARIETMPGLGWMLTRKLFMDELKSRWPPASQQHDWDMWIRTPGVRRGRECVIPDVSRTYHFGSTGTNINSYFQRQYFSKHAFSEYDLAERSQSVVTFDDASTLERDNYELAIEAVLSGDSDHPQQVFAGSNINNVEASRKTTTTIVALTREELCSCNLYDRASYNSTSSNSRGAQEHRTRGKSGQSLLLLDQQDNTNNADSNTNTNTDTNNRGAIDDNGSDRSNGANKRPSVNVIYIKMIDSEDYRNWLRLAKCWHLWDLDARGQHKAMWRLYLRGRQTFVIGVPASPYSKFKPPQLLPYDFYSTTNATTTAAEAAAASVA